MWSCVINKRNKPTFVHRIYGSILDLTSTTVNVARLINNWDMRDMGSLSDHNYIIFDVLEEKQTREMKSTAQDWNTRKLDYRKLQEIIETLGAIESSQEFAQNLANIGDLVIPKKKSSKGRRAVYWWNQEMTQHRSECLIKRREYIKNVRRRHIAENSLFGKIIKKAK